MSQILLLIENQENHRFLSKWLVKNYEIISPNSNDDLWHSPPSFDLCILDPKSLIQLFTWISTTKQAEEPVFLPFLLVIAQVDVGTLNQRLSENVDDLIIAPIEPIELQMRVKILLRARTISLAHKVANEDIQKLNEFKSDLISMAFREFRQPLTSISASAQILKLYNSQLPQNQQQELFDSIKGSVIEIKQILDEIILSNKVEFSLKKFHPTPLDLASFCCDIAREVKFITDSDRIIKFISQIHYPNPSLDEHLVSYILRNLLIIAISYSPENSIIYFNLYCDRETVIFDIKYNEIDTLKKERDRLFEFLHRPSNIKEMSYLEFGLTIVKQAIDLHGGKITVKSKFGIGTTFSVTLPVSKKLETIYLNT
ncbi:MAG: ATP-binding protein [Heteroscytonema crispum UTEX LB 1556]